MNTAEFNAAFPEPQSILGLRLLPLSLGRYRLLKRFESPFVDDEKKEVDVATLNKELFFALVICGLPCQEFNRLVSTGGLKKELKRWGKILRRIVNRKGFSILPHIEAFRKFLERESNIPWVILVKQDGSDSSMTHWSTSIESTLRSKMGWTEDQVNNQPLTKALADYFVYLESEGMVKLYDPDYYESIQGEAAANGAALEAYLKEMEKHGA